VLADPSLSTLLTVDTLAHDVAHGVHSLMAEDLRSFFGVPGDNNAVPTVNWDRFYKTPFRPKTTYSDEFSSSNFE
jgi:hypothetical protein